MKITGSLCCIVILLLTCCNGSRNNKQYSMLLQNLEQKSKRALTEYKAVFFVPSSGCGGCINGAENYLLHSYINEGKKGVLFIITGHTSEKSVRVRLGSAALKHPDVYCDYENFFDRPPFMMQYPKVLLLDDGDVRSEQEINPKSGDEVYAFLDQL